MPSIMPWFSILVVSAAFLTGCGGSGPLTSERYLESDAFITQVKHNISSSAGLVEIADIDHSRLAHEAGSPIPPTRVLIFSDAQVESQLIKINPLVALDLPLRVLAFEDEAGQPSKVIYNSFDYLVSRYQLDAEKTMSLRNGYSQAIAEATLGIPASARTAFEDNTMQPNGIITIESPFGYQQTIKKVNEAINAQGDTVHFGTVDFAANARAVGVDILPSYMVLFGGPGPGGKAMSSAQTLGLDGFCQKFLIWQDNQGRTHLSFNDLLALADRQQVPKAVVLRVIAFRLEKVFTDALKG